MRTEMVTVRFCCRFALEALVTRGWDSKIPPGLVEAAQPLFPQKARTKEKPKELFLCTGHPKRSEMAEGFLRQLAGDKLTQSSAATEPVPVSPLCRSRP